MSKVKIVDIWNKKTPKQCIATPIANAFNSIRNYKTPTMKHDLLRKRKKVK